MKVESTTTKSLTPHPPHYLTAQGPGAQGPRGAGLLQTCPASQVPATCFQGAGKGNIYCLPPPTSPLTLAGDSREGRERRIGHQKNFGGPRARRERGEKRGSGGGPSSSGEVRGAGAGASRRSGRPSLPCPRAGSGPPPPPLLRRRRRLRPFAAAASLFLPPLLPVRTAAAGVGVRAVRSVGERAAPGKAGGVGSPSGMTALGSGREGCGWGAWAPRDAASIPRAGGSAVPASPAALATAEPPGPAGGPDGALPSAAGLR